jgi:hypothetical protein
VLVALAVCASVAVPTVRAQERQEAVSARVVGTVVGIDGRPAAGAPIRVVATDTGFAGMFFALFTLGLACVLPEACGGEDDVDSTVTDAEGRYEATLPDAYVAGTETDTDWLVTASRPAAPGDAAGPASTFEFEVNTAVQEAPPLPLWEARTNVRVERWRALFDAPAPPSGLESPRIVVSSGGSAVESIDGLTGELDLRLLEPEQGLADQIIGAATASANVTVRHAEGRTIYHQRVTSAAPTIPLSPQQLVPPSRGAACTHAFDSGRPAQDDRCAVTDGSFATRPIVPADDGRLLTSVTVELGTPISLADVFVRGCDASCVVDASGDGTSWAPLTNDVAGSRLSEIGRPTVLIASLRPALPARYVRVTRAAGLAAAEVSAWPPDPPARIPPAEAAPSRDAPAAAGAPREEDESDRSSAVVPAVVAAALAGAVGVTAVRRRRAG